MSESLAVVSSGARPVDPAMTSSRAERIHPTRSETQRPSRPSDRVEISEKARYLAELRAVPEVRDELIDRVRDEIGRGTYDTPERLSEAVDALVSDLDLFA